MFPGAFEQAQRRVVKRHAAACFSGTLSEACVDAACAACPRAYPQGGAHSMGTTGRGPNATPLAQYLEAIRVVVAFRRAFS